MIFFLGAFADSKTKKQVKFLVLIDLHGRVILGNPVLFSLCSPPLPSSLVSPPPPPPHTHTHTTPWISEDAAEWNLNRVSCFS